MRALAGATVLTRPSKTFHDPAETAISSYLQAWIRAPRLVMVAGVPICSAASVAASGGTNRATR
jgi:hypothetical protein